MGDSTVAKEGGPRRSQRDWLRAGLSDLPAESGFARHLESCRHCTLGRIVTRIGYRSGLTPAASVAAEAAADLVPRAAQAGSSRRPETTPEKRSVDPAPLRNCRLPTTRSAVIQKSKAGASGRSPGRA